MIAPRARASAIGADAYLRCMMEDAEWAGHPVEWPTIDRIIEAASSSSQCCYESANRNIVFVNEQETKPMSHPLQYEIENAQDMIRRIEESAETLAAAIAWEKTARQHLADAKQTLAGMEAELVSDAVVMSAAGEGVLAGIAKTSKAFETSLDALKVRSHRNGLAPYVAAVADAQRRYTEASIALESSQTRFSALRHASELQAAILKAGLM
jgi:hypothetical protein